MKKLILFTIFLLAPITVFGQCTEGSVCVSQATIDRAAKAIDELTASRDAIKKLEIERLVTDAERKAAAVLIDNLNAVIATGLRVQGEQDKIIELYKSVVTMQAGIIERLEKMLSKPKSGWQKLLATLKEIALVLTGITLGRGL